MRRAIFFAVLLLAVAPVSAATFRATDAFMLPSPLSDDLYVAGSTVSITKDVQGDIFGAGRLVDIESNISGSVNVAGNSVRVQSTIDGDVRAAGNDVIIRGTIKGDLLVFGNNVVIGSDAVVLGDTVVSGGNVIIRGSIAKNVTVRGGSVTLEGIFHGNVDARGMSVSVNGPVEGNALLSGQSLIILPSAAFKGTVSYWSQNPVNFGKSLASGQHPTFRSDVQQNVRAPRTPLQELHLGATIFWFLTSLLLVTLFTFLTKRAFADASAILLRNPWRCLLTGLLYFVVTPFAALIAFLTLIGFPVGMTLLAAYVLTFFFAPAYTAMVLARWAETEWKHHWTRPQVFLVSAGALLIYTLCGFVPFAGWAVKAVLVLFTTGAVLRMKAVKWKKVM